MNSKEINNDNSSNGNIDIVIKSNKKKYGITKFAYSVIKMLTKIFKFSNKNKKNKFGNKKIIYGKSSQTYKYEPNCIYVYRYTYNSNEGDDIHDIYNSLENDDESFYENDDNSFENESIDYPPRSLKTR